MKHNVANHRVLLLLKMKFDLSGEEKEKIHVSPYEIA